MAKKVVTEEVEETLNENIQTELLEEVMGDRFGTYAKYVIQDRAIPDVRDGMKPVQRRIIFTMYKTGNTINHPTKKCAHTVGAVMGTFHPHGDTSIYEALARMSQDWKVRYPLINFQGNNGSIDGDSPAAYRYTESRLSMLSNEMIRGIDKSTVDMQLNFDDTELEPTVLPARFPNLFANGCEGIAVGLATEIPPHNLNELIDAIIYRINHKNVTCEDLMQFVKGPDFPTGGIIYKSQGLKDIYLTGRGRIEVAAKVDIVEDKAINQLVITEIPYQLVKINLVYEIDKVRHDKKIDGILEVRDESDWKGIRIVVDLRKDIDAGKVLAYLYSNTSLLSTYTANMVAIDSGRPRILSLLDYVDAYIAHQVNVVTRESKSDLEKYQARLHIVEGLLIASLNIKEVVEIIQKSKDKADSKVNLIAKYQLSNEQAEAIVMMPLYKLSHTDEITLENEKKQLLKDIETLTGILSDENKLHRVIIKDLKNIASTYGDDRRTQIIEKGDMLNYSKRDLIAQEDVMIAVTKDGYFKRSSIKSYRGSGDDSLPGLKSGDILVAKGIANTRDYAVCFTNFGNYIVIPVYKMVENKWKDEGVHMNTYSSMSSGEKIIKVITFTDFREDLFLCFVSKFGSIKKTQLSLLGQSRNGRSTKCMKLLKDDEVVGVEVLNGRNDIMVLTSNGECVLYNEDGINPTGPKSGGVKAAPNLKKQTIVSMITFDEGEKGKVVLITNKGCQRIFSTDKATKSVRPGKVLLPMYSCFKSDIHTLVGVLKAPKSGEELTFALAYDNQEVGVFKINDFTLSDTINAKKNLDIPAKTLITDVIETSITHVDDKMPSYVDLSKLTKDKDDDSGEEDKEKDSTDSEVEQISIFEGLDD